jgi:putative two-component system response regulator
MSVPVFDEDPAVSRTEILTMLARLAEGRDGGTFAHGERVGEMSARLAGALGESDERARLLRIAAPLHDIGKIVLRDSLLLKPGRLSPAEFEIVKTHARVGARILEGSRAPELRLAQVIALTHHERWDGSGYPQGLRGKEIPLSGRIVALADAFDALVSPRCYKPAWPLDRALGEIVAQRGRHFAPDVVDALLTLDRSTLHRSDRELLAA